MVAIGQVFAAERFMKRRGTWVVDSSDGVRRSVAANVSRYGGVIMSAGIRYEAVESILEGLEPEQESFGPGRGKHAPATIVSQCAWAHVHFSDVGVRGLQREVLGWLRSRALPYLDRYRDCRVALRDILEGRELTMMGRFFQARAAVGISVYIEDTESFRRASELPVPPVDEVAFAELVERARRVAGAPDHQGHQATEGGGDP